MTMSRQCFQSISRVLHCAHEEVSAMRFPEPPYSSKDRQHLGSPEDSVLDGGIRLQDTHSCLLRVMWVICVQKVAGGGVH